MAVCPRWIAVSACLAALVTVHTTRARAQGRYDVEAFDVAPLGPGSVLNVYGARTLEPLAYSVALFGSYAYAPLSVETLDGAHLGDLVGSVGSLQLTAALGLFRHVDLGIALAVHRTGRGSDFGVAELDAAALPQAKLAFGDIRLIPRVSLYDHAGDSGFDVALLAPLWLPTGSDAAYAGEPFRVEPRLAVDYHSPRVSLALNAGYLVRSRAQVVNTEANDQVRLALGADLGIAAGFGVQATFDTRLNVLAGKFNDDDVDSELLFGLRYRAGWFRAQLGAGPGLSHALSAPDYRVFLGLGIESSSSAGDADRDGVPDARDRCPNSAEDADGFRDEDGCPDPDNDADGISDVLDKCPDEAEDMDGDADADGCPDAPRARVVTPHDSDGDGIEDTADHCPNEAEDPDGFEDRDGCPDPDNDSDGVADGKDRCPLDAGVGQPDGCPVTDDVPLVFRKNVRFEKDSWDIDPSFDAQLNEVADYLIAHPEIQLIRVDGHADDRGSVRWNERLSTLRAETVRDALWGRGVKRRRLKTAAHGADQPIVSGTSDDARAQNRRVELHVERSSRTPSSGSKTP